MTRKSVPPQLMVIGEAPRDGNNRAAGTWELLGICGRVVYAEQASEFLTPRGSVPKGSEASEALYCGDLTGREKNIRRTGDMMQCLSPLIFIACVRTRRGFTDQRFWNHEM